MSTTDTKNEQDVYVKNDLVQNKELKSRKPEINMRIKNPYNSDSFTFLESKEKEAIQKLSKINSKTKPETFEQLINTINNPNDLYKTLYFTSKEEANLPQVKRSNSIFYTMLTKAPHLMSTFIKNDQNFNDNFKNHELNFFRGLNDLIIMSTTKHKNFKTLKSQLEKMDINTIYPKPQEDEQEAYKNARKTILQNLTFFINPENMIIHSKNKKFDNEQYERFKDIVEPIQNIIEPLDALDIDKSGLSVDTILDKYLTTEQFKDFLNTFDIEINKEDVYQPKFFNYSLFNNNENENEKNDKIDRIQFYHENGTKVDFVDRNLIESLSEKRPELLTGLSKQSMNPEEAAQTIKYSYDILQDNPNNDSVKQLFKTMQSKLLNYDIEKDLKEKSKKEPEASKKTHKHKM